MKRLSHLSVLAIDCQATRSDPSTGHLVEIGWLETQAASSFNKEKTAEAAKSYLVKTENVSRIPRKFLAMTGIKSAEIEKGVSKKSVWNELWQESKKTKSANQGICPAVIHFKRYEEPYLKQLHQEFAPLEDFPFTIICTHEIVSKLYPGLPRKSLRAAAGFFGCSLPRLRRSLHHVAATAFIWNHVVRILEQREKVVTLSHLRDWVCHPPAHFHGKQPAMEYPMEKSLRHGLPDKPGIYRLYRSTGDVLYIGKAKSIQRRVNSYFHSKGRHAEHILEMLSQAKNLETTVTDTALEAAVRESDEIKHKSPPYNRALQPEKRHILFYSLSFKKKRPKPDNLHPMGPFSSSADMEPMAIFMDVLNGRTKNFSYRLIESLLHIPPEYAPDKGCFKQGLAAFKDNFLQDTSQAVHWAHIMKWGTQFWEEKLAERQQARQKDSRRDEDTVLGDEEREDREEGWNPERVFRALKRQVRMGSFQMRRARWFCRLSESILTWTDANDKRNKKHMILIENGVPIFGKSSLHPDGTFFPAGHKKTLLNRQKNFDIAAYDRMRIVTTEMRRIVQEGRDVELCFHPGIILRNAELEKILPWV